MYTGIEDMPLYNFIKCLCDKDLSYLYKNKPKKRDENKEQNHFAGIVMDYADRLPESKYYTKQIIKHNILLCNIRILEASLSYVHNMPLKIKEMIRKLGVKVKGNQRDLLLIIAKRDFFIRQYNSKVSEFEQQPELKIEHFYKTVSTLSIHFKFYLDVQKITVADYCSFLVNYTEEINHLKKINQNENGSRKYK